MKEQIYEFIVAATKDFDIDHANAGVIGKTLSLSRSVVSQYLNKWVMEGRLCKINTRPVIFFDVETIHQIHGIIPTKQEYFSLQELEEELHGNQAHDFDFLIGNDGSLRDVVKHCKASVAYPPNGLPILLHGATGTGKSLIAKKMYEFAKYRELISPDAKFVTVNCSEFANNPELLSANLFGSVKGAYTGADKDNPGLLHAAEGGVLFLDEVHCLKAECQEKLFLFMDQGIYHMMGDNETWHHGHVRLLFATTEDPQRVLLKTLLRRIVMIIELPTLLMRGTHERIALMHGILTKEAKRINRDIALSNQAYNILLTAPFPGNIGELESCIQASCVQALFDQEQDTLMIHARHLPMSLLDKNKGSIKSKSVNSIMTLDTMKQLITTRRPFIKLMDYLDACYQAKKGMEAELVMTAMQDIVEEHLSTFPALESDLLNPYIQDVLVHTWESILPRYGITIRSNQKDKPLYILTEGIHQYHLLEQWYQANETSWNMIASFLQNQIHREMSIAQELMEAVGQDLDQEISVLIQPLLALLIHHLNDNRDISRRVGIIIAHGESTATSIANAVNQFLGQYIFDAIDMPMDVSTSQIVESLHSYLSKLGNFEELVLLVDMGSLEEIHKGISSVHANIAMMNNVNTRIALEIGNCLIQHVDLETMLSQTAQNCSYRYQVLDHRAQEKAIICSCASGIGAAEKLREIIHNSLPKNIPIRVLTCEYSDLLKYQELPLFQRYDVICIVGTLNPNLDYIHFIPIEDLIINETLDELDTYFKDYLDDGELKQFKQNILKNFSLSNIMNNLTILNPNKLLEHVAEAIDALQTLLQVTFSNHTCFGLYVHICCLIERLVTLREINDYDDMDSFVRDHGDFIRNVHTAFQDVETYYHITINVEEIGYIYDYIRNN